MAIQSRYISNEQQIMESGMFSPVCRPTPSDSIEITAEAPKRVISHIITRESAQYETRDRRQVIPPRHGGPMRASNYEIEEEMRLYSTVQSYDKGSHKKQFTPSASAGGKDWLRKTLQSRLN